LDSRWPHNTNLTANVNADIVRALLPLGEGTLLDPFMGSGSTIAAAEAVGYDSIGVELDDEYFRLAERSIPRLAALYPDFVGEELQMNGDYGSVEREDGQQLSMVLAEKKATYQAKLSAKTRRS
jgi:DNA methylase